MEKDDCKKGNEAMGAGVQATPKVKATEVLFRVEGRKEKTVATSELQAIHFQLASETPSKCEGETDLVEEHEPLRKKAKRAAGSSWTDKHEKHENKLRDLATSRRFEAQRSGHLVEGEKKISSNKYQEMEEKQFANDKATKRKNAMVSQVLGVTQPNLI